MKTYVKSNLHPMQRLKVLFVVLFWSKNVRYSYRINAVNSFNDFN